MTPGERRALLWLPADGSARPSVGGRQAAGHGRVFYRLERAGLAERVSVRPASYRATAEGLVIRATIERLQDGSEKSAAALDTPLDAAAEQSVSPVTATGWTRRKAEGLPPE